MYSEIRTEMVLKNTKTEELLEAVIEKMTPKDFKVVKRDSARFDKFNWTAYKNKEVYKIRLINDENILGLICIMEHLDQSIDAIEISLLELSVENIGKEKKFDFIGGCLIAFACRESFRRGHDGVVFLVPKSGLIEHYSTIYGFIHWPHRTIERPEGIMLLYDLNSRQLIKKFLE